jgi:pantetheine-phosphate adenylyltransferase
MVKAVFPGSFDPPTYGHLNILSRGAVLFDSLDVVIAVNPNKTPLLSAERIKALFEEQLSIMKLEHVRVTIYEGLIVDYCSSVNASVLLRGVRSAADFNYEFELSILNKQLNEKIETVLIPTDPKYFVLRSSTIKELLNLGGDISAMVPPAVERALIKLHGKKT